MSRGWFIGAGVLYTNLFDRWNALKRGGNNLRGGQVVVGATVDEEILMIVRDTEWREQWVPSLEGIPILRGLFRHVE
jgi:hypothetical protein